MMRGPVHILDDDPAVLKSLDRLLRAAGYETMPYDSAFALLEAAARLSGCVLLDIRMPGIDGLEVHRRLAGGDAPIILMTGHGDVGMAVEALKAGAVDFLEKPFSEEKLFGAIEAALLKSGARATQGIAMEAERKVAKLSPREREVLNGLVQGEANKVIAHRLGISVRTVELHRSRMLRRLGTRHLADAIKLAVLAELCLDGEVPPVRSIQ
jgi:two-component system response regulator FixJ